MSTEKEQKSKGSSAFTDKQVENPDSLDDFKKLLGTVPGGNSHTRTQSSDTGDPPPGDDLPPEDEYGPHIPPGEEDPLEDEGMDYRAIEWEQQRARESLDFFDWVTGVPGSVVNKVSPDNYTLDNLMEYGDQAKGWFANRYYERINQFENYLPEKYIFFGLIILALVFKTYVIWQHSQQMKAEKKRKEKARKEAREPEDTTVKPEDVDDAQEPEIINYEELKGAGS